jgi:hypothetical protein
MRNLYTQHTTAELAKKEFDTPNNPVDFIIENKQRSQPQTSHVPEEKNRDKNDYYITSTHSRRNPDLLTAFGSLKGNSYFKKSVSG